ncbi:hypothetical protein A2U01_0112185, partial [Trifolium medium]|nr:hypothetical protein [Trifolium medium]
KGIAMFYEKGFLSKDQLVNKIQVVSWWWLKARKRMLSLI